MGRVALVTGGTRGIGKAISVALKEDGYTGAANYAANPEAAAKFKAIWTAYQDDVIFAHQTDDLSDSQPTKGNILGGLTTIEEKALGNLEKIGRTSQYIDAMGPAETPAKGPGLYFMDSSSAAAECVTLMAAGGYVIHTFPTGQGNVVGNPIVPVIKISGNPRTLRTMSEHIDVDVTGVVDDFTVATNDAAGEAGTELPLSIDVGLTDLDGSETVSVTLTGIPEGATLNHGTFDEGTGNWTLSGDDLEGLTISLPETVEGEGGGEPQTLYSQNFNDTFDGQTAAGGANGFPSTGGDWGEDYRTAADNDRFEFQNPENGDTSTWSSAEIDISGQEDSPFNFELKGRGRLDSGTSSYSDYFTVIAVVDGGETPTDDRRR